MNKLAVNFILLISLLVLGSCASKTYEWIKINDAKVAHVKALRSSPEKINRVDILVNAKYKAENIIYVDNSSDYFESQIFQKVKGEKKLIAENNAKSSWEVKFGVLKKPEHIKITAKEEAAMNKLNNGLIFNKRHKHVKQTLSKKARVNIDSDRNKKNLTSDKRLKPLEAKNAELRNSEIKDFGVEFSSNNQVKEDVAKRKNFLWIGLVLLIVGLIAGLIFGRFAYLISVIGIVFLLMSYIIKT